MNKAYKIRFENGQYARIAQVASDADPDEVRTLLGLRRGAASLVLHVGADLTAPEVVEELMPVFRDILAPLASKYQLPVIDGGTMAGVVGMMGVARRETNGAFPLIGVVPANNAFYPGSPAADGKGRIALDPNHTHFALVEGGSFGIESHLMVGLGQSIARHPAALFINGGEIVRHEALMHAKVHTPLLVLAGSGRVADEMVDALKRGTSNDILLATLAIGKIRVVTPENLRAQLESLLHLEA